MTKLLHSGRIIRVKFSRNQFPSPDLLSGLGQAIPTYSAGQVPETSSGQVMTIEKQIINI